ncbi:MAG: hypothetical protein ACT4PU_00945 [Planctomycetota bacterium]
MLRLCWLAIGLGLVLRVFAVTAHDVPRGDVLLDVGVARSLAEGEGFASGFTRGTALVVGDRPAPPLDRADQHAPLWPLLGAALSFPAGSAFGGLKLAALLCGLLLLKLVWRETDRLVEPVVGAPDGLPALATALVALSFLASDASGSGSLAIALAVLAVLLVRLLGAQQPRALPLGLVLGLAWLVAHQAVLLLPVPLIVLLATAPRGGRLAAARTGIFAIVVAALLQLPWAWRNAQVFGEAFFSVNGVYLLYSAGVEPVLSLANGWPEARFPDPAGVGWYLKGLRSWLLPNALYLLVTALIAWPGLLGLVLATAPAALLRLLRGRSLEGAPSGPNERRVLAALLLLLAFAAVALLWPATKLRYLVPMTPLIVLLGVARLAHPPTRGEGRGSIVAVLAWLAAVLLTLDDILGSSDAARPERWRILALGGLVLLALPLLLRARGWAGPGLRRALVSGLLFAPVFLGFAVLPQPHTSYHSTVLTPDVFGKQKERVEARRVATAAQARASALAAGSRRVVAGFEWLAWPEPALVSVPVGAGTAFGDEALAALIDAAAIDHVFVYSGEGWPEALQPGETWLGGRLEVVQAYAGTKDQEGGMLCRVRPGT